MWIRRGWRESLSELFNGNITSYKSNEQWREALSFSPMPKKGSDSEKLSPPTNTAINIPRFNLFMSAERKAREQKGSTRELHHITIHANLSFLLTIFFALLLLAADVE